LTFDEALENGVAQYREKANLKKAESYSEDDSNSELLFVDEKG